jgi:hypothetical protein
MKRFKLQMKVAQDQWIDALENDMNGELDIIPQDEDALAFIKEQFPQLEVRFVLEVTK